jgi:nucleotide-binding universal stress UspA family protein
MTIKHVTVPVDFSEVSVAAVDHARRLGVLAGATTELVAVTTPRYANVTGAALKSLADEHAGDAEMTYRVLETESEDIEGRLVEAVLTSTDTLWCVGSHGRTAVGELLFGSISADLVRDAEVPIVVVGPHAAVRPDASVLAVAVDGNDASEAIIPVALSIATDLGMSLRLLQVGVGHVPSDSSDSAYLAGLAKTLPDPDHADYDTLYGEVGEALTSYVDRTPDVAMLAMATRGIPAGARLSVPSVSMRVMRHAVVPVLMLHPREEGATLADSGHPGKREHIVDLRRRVVVGIDTYAASKPAVDWAVDEAVRREALLQVVHTWHIPVGPGSMYGYPIWPDVEACRNAAIEEVSSTAAAIHEQHPNLLVETIVAEGGAVQAISELSAGAQLLVLGRHHHGKIAKMLLGSTSESAARQVDCPLVIVPCDEPEQVAVGATT